MRIISSRSDAHSAVLSDMEFVLDKVKKEQTVAFAFSCVNSNGEIYTTWCHPSGASCIFTLIGANEMLSHRMKQDTLE